MEEKNLMVKLIVSFQPPPPPHCYNSTFIVMVMIKVPGYRQVYLMDTLTQLVKARGKQRTFRASWELGLQQLNVMRNRGNNTKWQLQRPLSHNVQLWRENFKIQSKSTAKVRVECFTHRDYTVDIQFTLHELLSCHQEPFVSSDYMTDYRQRGHKQRDLSLGDCSSSSWPFFLGFPWNPVTPCPVVSCDNLNSYSWLGSNQLHLKH